MQEVIQDGQGNIIEIIGTPGEIKKSVYTKSDFISKIPKNKIRQIQTAADTNDDINVWVFNLSLSTSNIDLNSPEPWFEEGLDAMVTVGIFTQNQIDNFLER